MVLPTLTLTGPSQLAPEVSLVMSPLVGSDSNTSFEFDRSSGRPGTASSTGNDDGKPVHVVIYVTRRERSWGTKAGMPLPRATTLEQAMQGTHESSC